MYLVTCIKTDATTVSSIDIQPITIEGDTQLPVIYENAPHSYDDDSSTIYIDHLLFEHLHDIFAHYENGIPEHHRVKIIAQMEHVDEDESLFTHFSHE